MDLPRLPAPIPPLPPGPHLHPGCTAITRWLPITRERVVRTIRFTDPHQVDDEHTAWLTEVDLSS